jgi:RNA polymerase sigma factor (sigma-70 family)
MSMTQLSNRELSVNVRHAAEIFEQHGIFIRTLIRYHTKRDDLTEDLYQDFFLSLLTKPIPPDVKNLKGFLYRTIANDVMDAINKIRRYKKLVQRYSEIHRNGQYRKKPEDQLIRAEETDKMFRFVTRQLTTAEARVITLRYRESFSTLEVAQKMKVSPRTVSRYLSVGLRKIRKSITAFKDNDHESS